MSAPTAGLAFLALRSRRTVPPSCQRSQEAGKKAGGDRGGGGGGRGGGGSGSRARESGRARSGARRLASPQLAQNTQASPCALEEGAGPPLPGWLLLGLRGPPAPGHPWNLRPQPCPRPPAAPGVRPGRAAGVSLSPGCARRVGKAGASLGAAKPWPPPSFSLKRAKALQTPGAYLPQSSLPVCLAFRGRRRAAGSRVPGPLSFCGFGGSAQQCARARRCTRLAWPAEAWGPEGMGKRSPFFPVPAILRFRFSLGASVANHAALGARLVAGSGRAPRGLASSRIQRER